MEDQQEYDRIIGECTAVLNASSEIEERAKALNSRGLAFTNRGKFDLAILDFTEAIDQKHSDKALATLYYNRGRCRSFMGEIEKAIEDFTEAIRLDCGHAKAYGMRGLAWQNLGEFQKAITDHNLAIRKDPVSADVYHNRGNAWVYLGELDKAIADFTKAISLDPQSATSYTSRGSTWRRKGRYARALADFERALELEPHSADRRLVLAFYLAVGPLSQYRDGNRAVKLMTEACEITDHENSEYLTYLAAAYAEQGDFASALAVLQKALPLATNDDEREDIRFCEGLYKAGKPWRMESPNWPQREARVDFFD